ncbi:MAG: ABC transporter ATP-binding protein [Legionellales bacterium]|nr:ABC transporter ATP-binding protein [Legionellales bacterium]|tara:strand:+ start:9435 stop:11162 length:1728 start_codon:yes stop_codon:yes gene_type:complete
MPLITLRNISLNFGHEPLLDGIDLTVDAKERICIVGRNGMGKSTLLKLINDELTPDDGEIIKQQHCIIAKLEQEMPEDTGLTVYDIVAKGLDAAALAHEAYKVDTVISKLDLPRDALFDGLSGGMKRRVLLAQALVCEPDILLLDEPTNHLDIAAIQWLEKFILEFKGTVIFITHDRAFLQRLATRIIQIDRGKLYSYPGTYQQFLERREHELVVEETQNKKFDKLLAQEEIWIRKGIKARRTRDEGRVRALKKLREERAQRRNQIGKANLRSQAIADSGKIVIDAEAVNFAYQHSTIISDFSTTILRGDKIGLIGPNGIGKTTLLKLLLGDLTPDTGKIKHGTKLEIAYFDQTRAQLDEDATVADNVSYGDQYIEFNGQSKHIMGYLQEFLFTPERARSKVSTLSGGERNRLLLARLFSKPANLLVMDEPTNDLDLETLELLEELLVNYQGTLLLVSHDRQFLDNVVSSSIAFEGDGNVVEYIGGYSDWQRQKADSSPAPSGKPKTASKPDYARQKEIKAIENKIHKLEEKQESLKEQLYDTELYIPENADKLKNMQDELKQIDTELGVLWDKL